MDRDEMIAAITTLLIQAENGYHLSEDDIKDAEIALNVAEQILNKAKRR